LLAAVLLLLPLPQACVHQDSLCTCFHSHACLHTVRCGAGNSSRHRSAGEPLLLLLLLLLLLHGSSCCMRCCLLNVQMTPVQYLAAAAAGEVQ
jgi:hypothetical protein